MTRTACAFGLLLAVAYTSSGAVVINFDDRPGHPGPTSAGTPVQPQFLVNDEYLGLGVLFDSGGGGVRISASSNPVSPPNVAGATGPGPVISYSEAVVSSFWIEGSPATVDSVQLTLSDSSSLSRLRAFAADGALLGTTMGEASAMLRIDAAGAIHRVVLDQGPFAFDDFTFDGLVPAPGTASLLMVAGLASGRRRR